MSIFTIIMKPRQINPKGAPEPEIAMITFDPTALTTSLTAEAEMLRASGSAPATVVQIEQGNLSVGAAAGVSDLASNRPAGASQTFEIGSQTKMMTAVVILQLVEQGLIDLDAAAAGYLPAATVAGIANADTATVRQLLNMTSGIANYTEAVDAGGIPLFINALLAHPDQVFGPEQALDIARTMPPVGAVGDGFFYTNTNYLLLGQIIEAQTGKSFVEALQDGIFTPSGMDSTGRQLATDDPRLSSYLDDGTGTLVDVTRALWEMRGEAGIVSTAADMITFLKALLVDKTLLGADALAEMTDFIETDSGPGFAAFFGLGLVKVTLDGGHTYVGFTGGTLGTGSSTYLDMDTGTIVSVGATTDALDSAAGGLALLQALEQAAAWQPVVDDGGPVHVASGTAADLRLDVSADGLAIALGTASLTLERTLAATTTASLSFADGSLLLVGDNSATGAGDQQGNSLNIARDFAGAVDRDNQLIGLGGNDRLTGGTGDDRLLGGAGHDRLRGMAGDDRLIGGAGQDVLAGGTGADRLRGGAGADTFQFRTGDSTAAGQDVIVDFEHGTDIFDLVSLAIGGPNSSFHWIGAQAFSGTAGELRSEATVQGSLVQTDADGNGIADLQVLVRTVQSLDAGDFLL